MNDEEARRIIINSITDFTYDIAVNGERLSYEALAGLIIDNLRMYNMEIIDATKFIFVKRDESK
jgi:hypothetical protein